MLLTVWLIVPVFWVPVRLPPPRLAQPPVRQQMHRPTETRTWTA